MINIRIVWIVALLVFSGGPLQAADSVPTDVQMPGSQPQFNIGNLETANKCDNCHGGYDPANEPAHNWNGSVMAHASADPLYWATVAIAEQDFDGAGDLCLRCHNPAGWLAGRSTPTDGSSLSQSSDTGGVECDLCHRLTDPDQSDGILGVQSEPFIARTGTEGHYGSGQFVIWDENSKLGPFDDAEARHQFLKSPFFRSSDLCGTCHDVSNPVVGDLAPNNGAQVPLAPGGYHGVPGSAVTGKAAFNNPPYKYGVVERTYSEHMASAFPTTPVSEFNSLPAELQTDGGSIKIAYDAAMAGGNNGNYEDGTVRNFTCQTCHMPPAAGAQGCNKNPRPRPDMPRHDLAGANYWILDVLQDMDTKGTLVIGGDYTSSEIAAMNDGKQRARNHLRSAATLAVTGDYQPNIRVTNLTGHKLISGYPEGRRMWLRAEWFDAAGQSLGIDGDYGELGVAVNGTQVRSIKDLSGSNTRIWEAHAAITRDWAAKLVSLDEAPGSTTDYASLVVGFDRTSGDVALTLGALASGAEDYHESFHFALNNRVIKDNRIPPYGVVCSKALERNILPVVNGVINGSGYGVSDISLDANGVPQCDTGSAVFNHFDDVTPVPPEGAVSAQIDLLYQSTSWEYIQFLYLANNGSVTFLANTGADILDGWVSSGMAEPFVMASAEWQGCSAGDPAVSIIPAAQDITAAGGSVTYTVTVVNNDVGTGCSPVTFNLAATDSDGLQFNPSTLTSSTVTLAAGESANVGLSVSVIVGTPSGQSNTTFVTATEENHSSADSNPVSTRLNVPPVGC